MEAGYEDFVSQLTAQQKRQFERYFELLVEWNEKMNLTALTAREDVWLKHFYDSVQPVLLGLLPADRAVSLLDVGAGAGFPSLPMKILMPELEVTILDSLQKRLNFLSALMEELGLTGVTLLHGRAEDFGQLAEQRAQYDVVSARAVARLNVLAELTLPFLKKGGQLLAFKAAALSDELTEAKTAIATLGGKVVSQASYQLADSARYILIVEKAKETPKKYPRNAGGIKKKPL